MALLIDQDSVEIVLGSFRVVAGMVISSRTSTDKLYNTIPTAFEHIRKAH